MRPASIRSWAWLAALGACGGESAPEAGPAAVSAPLAGVDGRADSADHACHVVLRRAGRLSDGRGGYHVQGSSWVVEAMVDVSDAAIADGAAPGLIYQARAGGAWREAGGSAVGGAGAGFQRFRFELARELPGPGMSGTSISRSRIEVAPYVRLREGGRAFDHNRNEDAFANYLLLGARGLVVDEDARVCPPGPAPAQPTSEVVTIDFSADGDVTPSAGVLEGHDLALAYDVARLPRCRESGWDVTAHVRFQPSGRVARGSIRDGRFVARVPEGSVRVEVWFENTSGATCRDWDSDGGRDHVFPVLRAPGWIGSPVVKITRETGHPCSGGSALTDGFRYDTWARERSVMGNACLEVWQQGTTDWDNPDMWRQLDARLYYRYAASEAFRFVHLDFVDRVGNNARLSTSVAALDPFRRYTCSDAPVTRVGGAGGSPQYDQAQTELYFWVNGRVLQRASGAPFTATFEAYPDDAWRAANCD